MKRKPTVALSDEVSSVSCDIVSIGWLNLRKVAYIIIVWCYDGSIRGRKISRTGAISRRRRRGAGRILRHRDIWVPVQLCSVWRVSDRLSLPSSLFKARRDLESDERRATARAIIYPLCETNECYPSSRMETIMHVGNVWWQGFGLLVGTTGQPASNKQGF